MSIVYRIILAPTQLRRRRLFDCSTPQIVVVSRILRTAVFSPLNYAFYNVIRVFQRLNRF